MNRIIMLASIFLLGTQLAAAETTVNFSGAEVIFLDSDNYLKKINESGDVAYVVTPTNTSVKGVQRGSVSNELIIVFNSRQTLGDGKEYYLAKTDTANNVLSGIDQSLENLNFSMDLEQVNNPSVQTDQARNIYYTMSGGQGLQLRKYSSETNITDLVNQNISLNYWLVLSDGSVLLSGKTMSTGQGWVRILWPDNNLETIAELGAYCDGAHFLKLFPDDRVYCGFWGSEFGGVYRLPEDFGYLSDYENNYIGAMNGGMFTPEYPIFDGEGGLGSTFGARIDGYQQVGDYIFVITDWDSDKALLRYYPEPTKLTLNHIDTVTVISKFTDKLVVAGIKNGENKLVLYDPVYEDEMSLLTENIEIYHLAELEDGSLWFDGLNFSGNQYIVGKLSLSVTPGVRGAVRSSYTQIATLQDKPNMMMSLIEAPEPDSPDLDDPDPDDPNPNRDALCVVNDFDGDGKSDLALYQEVSHRWSIFLSGSDSLWSQQFGDQGCAPVRGDYDGDGISDLAVYDESSGYWYILKSSDSSLSSAKWGDTGYAPVPADYDGDGKADLTVYCESGDWPGYWYILKSTDLSMSSAKWGDTGYTPVPADYDGDGIADLAVYCASGDWPGYWYILKSTDYTMSYAKWGDTGYTPVPADYDGDGIADLAVYCESGDWPGYWYILKSTDYTMSYMQLGAVGYTPVPGDYDGDGITDIAVYHEESGYWWMLLSGSGYALSYQQFGGPGYVPVR